MGGSFTGLIRAGNRWLGARTGVHLARAGAAGSTLSRPEIAVDDPRLAAYYRDKAGTEVRFNAPAERGVLEAFALGPRSAHPYVVAARAATTSRDPGKAVRTILTRYYTLVRPATTAAWLDIPADLGSVLAVGRPAPAFLPWTMRSLDEHLVREEQIARAENDLHGLDEGTTAGCKAFGPMSTAKIAIETDRLLRIVEAIGRQGLDHRRPDYILFATILVADGEWRWMARGGTHRAAIASPLGIDPIPMRVGSIVRRDEVDLWPQVIAGRFQREVALQVFDRLFERRSPAVVVPWLRWVEEYEQKQGSDEPADGGARS